MGRKVFVSSDMSTDPGLYEVSKTRPELALLWPWFLTMFDDWGRADANPNQIKLRIFPGIGHVDTIMIADALIAFAEAGLLVVYRHEGRDYVAVHSENWFHYQTHIHRSKRDRDESHFPPPPTIPQEVRGESRKCAEHRGSARRIAGSVRFSFHPTTPPPFAFAFG